MSQFTLCSPIRSHERPTCSHWVLSCEINVLTVPKNNRSRKTRLMRGISPSHERPFPFHACWGKHTSAHILARSPTLTRVSIYGRALVKNDYFWVKTIFTWSPKCPLGRPLSHICAHLAAQACFLTLACSICCLFVKNKACSSRNWLLQVTFGWISERHLPKICTVSLFFGLSLFRSLLICQCVLCLCHCLYLSLYIPQPFILSFSSLSLCVSVSSSWFVSVCVSVRFVHLPVWHWLSLQGLLFLFLSRIPLGHLPC